MSKPSYVLVTGGAGYIGAHTAVELALAGFEPVLIDNLSRSNERLLKGIAEVLGRNLIFHRGDCRDEKFLEGIFAKYPIIGVLHFAAFKAVGESVQQPELYYNNNLNSTLTLVRVMARVGVKPLVFSSSCTVYGEPDHIPVDESAPLKRAESPYGATKQMSERILEDEANTGRLRVISLRYFNPIGAHPSARLGELPIGEPSNLVPYVTQAAAGKRKSLTVFGNDYPTPDGYCIRDFIHVVDLAKAHVAALQRLLRDEQGEFFEVINLGAGHGVSVLELINTFVRVTGVRVPFTIGPRRPGDVVNTYADVKRARERLKWQCEYSLDDALRHAWAWEQQLIHSTP
ncbi:MAG: UDP-glucose 4-epimerase GalE [Cyclobacteriaceae bacterium]|nr:UDP-glucose 4-epimerase GalE [Flammeovirgaceae bacterium]